MQAFVYAGVVFFAVAALGCGPSRQGSSGARANDGEPTSGGGATQTAQPMISPAVEERRTVELPRDVTTQPTTTERQPTERRPFGQENINRVLVQRQADFNACYDQALVRNDRARGTLRVQFTVRPDGSVSNAYAVDDTIGDAELDQCIIGILVGLRWAEPPFRPMTFTHPFEFAPSGS
jgi:hypothetical protein